MKIRTGFVSNSSSSSFVVFATEKQIDEALKKIDKKYRSWIETRFTKHSVKVKFEGKEYLRKLGDYNTDDMPSEFCDDDEDIDNFNTAIDKFFDDIGPVSCIDPI